MKVLLCTPYLQTPNIVSGGINMWGKNILDYYEQSGKEIIIRAVSFDRTYNVREKSPFFQRFIWGVRDYAHSIKKAKRELKEEGNFNIIHLCTSAQMGLVKDYVVIRNAHKYGVKVVLHLHFGRLPDLLKEDNWECKLLKRVLRLSDAIAVMDSCSYNALQSCGYRNSYYIPNPLSNSVIQFIESHSQLIQRISRKVLYVGHVIPSKGVYELVKACKDIHSIELHLVGTINEEIRNTLMEIASDKDNGRWLKIRGNMSHEEVIREMLSCEVFTLPSYTEGFPNVILEAMACGCAIVATKVGAIEEMLVYNNKCCGLVIPPKNVGALRSEIEECLNNESMRNEFKEATKQKVNDSYAMPIVWNQLVNMWDNVIRNY